MILGLYSWKIGQELQRNREVAGIAGGLFSDVRIRIDAADGASKEKA
jgi:hypothetical protein